MKKSKSEKIVLWITFAIFLAYAVSLVYPLIWIAINAFKTPEEFFIYPFKKPESFYWKNFLEAFAMEYRRTNLVGMFKNSLILCVGCTFVSVFVPTITAYVISKYDFRGRNFIYSVAIATMLIPTTGTLASLYGLMNDLQLLNKYIGIIIMSSGGFGFNFVMVYGFFRTISWSYAEAAMLDGADDFQIFVRVMIPQVLPSLVAIGIISLINYWNDYFTPYMFLRAHPTVAVGLEKFLQQAESKNEWPKLFAAILISITPMIAIFSVFQKTIMENTVAGGLKG